MSQFLQQAKHHIERIEYFFRNSGGDGYDFASYHYSMLENVTRDSFRSKNGMDEFIVIEALRKSIDGKMEELKQREKDLMRLTLSNNATPVV